MLRPSRARRRVHATSTTKIDRLERRECPSTSPVSTPWSRDQRSRRLAYTTSCAACGGAAAIFIAVDTPPRGDPVTPTSRSCARGCARGRESVGQRRLVMTKSPSQSEPPRGQADLDDTGCAHRVAYASNPEFLREGAAIADFMEPGTAWSAGSTTLLRTSAVVEALCRHRLPDSSHRRGPRRNDQVRLQCLPGHQDLASSTRSPTCANR